MPGTPGGKLQPSEIFFSLGPLSVNFTHTLPHAVFAYLEDECLSEACVFKVWSQLGTIERLWNF